MIANVRFVIFGVLAIAVVAIGYWGYAQERRVDPAEEVRGSTVQDR